MGTQLLPSLKLDLLISNSFLNFQDNLRRALSSYIAVDDVHSVVATTMRAKATLLSNAKSEYNVI